MIADSVGGVTRTARDAAPRSLGPDAWTRLHVPVAARLDVSYTAFRHRPERTLDVGGQE